MTPYRSRLCSLTLLITLLLGLVPGCGGSTTGSGGVTVDGRLVTEQGAPLADVAVIDALTGDSDSMDANGGFGILTERSSSIQLIFQGQGLDTQATITDLPSDVSRVSATFKARVEENSVRAEDIAVEERPSSSSRSSSRSSSSSTGSAASSSSTDQSSSSASDDDDDGSSSSSDDDDSSSSSSEDDETSSGSSSSSGSQIVREGLIQSISPTLVRVQSTDFVPQGDTEYRDADGDDASLSDFTVGTPVKARGRSEDGIIKLERLEIED